MILHVEDGVPGVRVDNREKLYYLLEGVMANAGIMWSEYVDYDKDVATVRPIEEHILAEIRGDAPVSETESEDIDDSPVLSVESVTNYLHKLRDFALVSNNLKLLELMSQSCGRTDSTVVCEPIFGLPLFH